MPFYRVLIEGSNLDIPNEVGDPPIVGFFTSRVLWSNSKADAEIKALNSVKQLWERGGYFTKSSAGQLALSVSESGPASLWQWLTAPNKGHAFFAAESAREA